MNGRTLWLALLFALGTASVAACSSGGGGSSAGSDAGSSSGNIGADGGKGVDSSSSGDSGGPHDDGGAAACGAFNEPCCAGEQCSSSSLECQSGTCGQPKPTGETGKSCSKNGDCTTGICVPIGNGQNVCTTSCTGASDCVAGWSCSPLIGQSSSICQCKSSPEACNGLDDDCNGIVDDEPEVDDGCKQKDGSTYACTGGACSCLAQYSCGSACVDTSSDTQSCGSCGHACATGQSCSGGQCSCAGTQLLCGGACVGVSTSYHDCSGACASNTDVATCGASCSACPTDPNGIASCNGQRCSLTCNSGYVTCSTGCCQTCATTGCTGLTYCDSTTGLCTAGCDEQTQCDASSGLFCDLTQHTCAHSVMVANALAACPTGWTYLPQCSSGPEYCGNPDLPAGTTWVYQNASCPAGSTARGGYTCVVDVDTYNASCCVLGN